MFLNTNLWDKQWHEHRYLWLPLLSTQPPTSLVTFSYIPHINFAHLLCHPTERLWARIRSHSMTLHQPVFYRLLNASIFSVFSAFSFADRAQTCTFSVARLPTAHQIATHWCHLKMTKWVHTYISQSCSLQTTQMRILHFAAPRSLKVLFQLARPGKPNNAASCKSVGCHLQHWGTHRLTIYVPRKKLTCDWCRKSNIYAAREAEVLRQVSSGVDMTQRVKATVNTGLNIWHMNRNSYPVVF